MSNITYASILRTYLAPQRGRVVLLLALLLGGAGLTLVNPRLLAAFIDTVLAGGQNDTLRLGALFLALALVNQLVTIATSYLSTDVGLRATNRIRADLTLHCLGLDMSFHNSTTSGTLIERIDGDVSQLNRFLSDFGVTLLKNLLLIGGSLVAIAMIDWRAGLVIGALVVLAIALLEIARRISMRPFQHERETSAQLFSTVEERLAGIEDMRANGADAYVMRRFAERSRAWGWAHVKAHTVGALTHQTASITFTIALALTLGLAAWLVTAGTITIGAAYAIFRYVEIMRWPISHLGRQIQHVQQAGASIIRLRELFAQQSAIKDTGTARLPTTPLTIAFQNVTFAYPPSAAGDDANRPALHELSFRLPAGQTLGLLGRTGSGKTTMTRLLLRFYEPEQGTISLDQLPLDEITLASLREQVGLVTQEVNIFSASVRDNLRLFDPTIPDARIEAAIAAVELDGWLASLPNGLDTVLPPGGGISAGQAQLLAVARVLLRDPGLIILDEASARLDPATEQRLEHALARLLAGRTAIIIAHRLATVQRADWIMILEDGRCVEFGPRDQLAAEPRSHFAQLLRVGMEEALV